MAYNKRYSSKRESAFYIENAYKIEINRYFTDTIVDGGYATTVRTPQDPVFEAGSANTIYTIDDIVLDGGSA